MNTRDMQIFIKIADYRSITRTAEDIRMTQPAVSSALKRLEEEIGYPLFVRRGKWLILNEQGKLFYDAANEFLAEMEHVESGLQVDGENKAELVIKMNIHSDKLYSLMGMFTGENPDVRITLRQGTGTDAEDFRTNAFEVILFSENDEDRMFLPLEHRGALYAIIPNDHPLVSYGQLTVQDLRNENYVFLRQSGPTGVEAAYQTCINSGFRPVISMVTDSNTSKYSAIRRGCGIGLTFDNAFSLAPLIKDCRLVPVDMPLKIEWLGLSWNQKDLDETAVRFLEFVKERV